MLTTAELQENSQCKPASAQLLACSDCLAIKHSNIPHGFDACKAQAISISAGVHRRPHPLRRVASPM